MLCNFDNLLSVHKCQHGELIIVGDDSFSHVHCNVDYKNKTFITSEQKRINFWCEESIVPEQKMKSE